MTQINQIPLISTLTPATLLEVEEGAESGRATLASVLAGGLSVVNIPYAASVDLSQGSSMVITLTSDTIMSFTDLEAGAVVTLDVLGDFELTFGGTGYSKHRVSRLPRRIGNNLRSLKILNTGTLGSPDFRISDYIGPEIVIPMTLTPDGEPAANGLNLEGIHFMTAGFVVNQIVVGNKITVTTNPVIIDGNKNGTTMYSTNPQIDVGDKISTDSLTPQVFTNDAARTFDVGDELTVDIDSTGGAERVTAYVVGYETGN